MGSAYPNFPPDKNFSFWTGESWAERSEAGYAVLSVVASGASATATRQYAEPIVSKSERSERLLTTPFITTC